MKPKVLVCTSTYPRWANDTEPAFVHYLNTYISDENEIHVLAPHYKNSKTYETILNIHIHRFRYFLEKHENLCYNGGILANLKKHRWNYLIVPFFFLSQYIKLILLHKKQDFDLIHAHWIIPQGIVAAFFKVFYPNVKMIITSHGGDLFALNSTLFKKLKIWVLTKADHITVVSNPMKDLCISWGIDKNKITTISMGVDLTHQFISYSKYTRADCIFAGRLVEKKGVQYLIEAIHIVSKKIPDIHLSIVGDGPERTSLENKVKKLSLKKNISFLGAVPNETMPMHYNSKAIMVMPSIITDNGDQEGLGLVAIEALGCGCAVIASDLPAIKDFMNKDISILVPEKSPHILAHAIIRLLTNTELLKQIAAKGHDYAVKNFDWRVKSLEYKVIYRRLISNK